MDFLPQISWITTMVLMNLRLALIRSENPLATNPRLFPADLKKPEIRTNYFAVVLLFHIVRGHTQLYQSVYAINTDPF